MKQKTAAARLKELRVELAYWQMRARMDARCLKGSYRKCHEIGAEMRALQKEKAGKKWRR